MVSKQEVASESCSASEPAVVRYENREAFFSDMVNGKIKGKVFFGKGLDAETMAFTNALTRSFHQAKIAALREAKS